MHTDNKVVNLQLIKDKSASLIETANRAQQALHKGQVRKFSGEPYHTHPQQVAELVKQYTTDETIICAAYLHDVIEDCSEYVDFSQLIEIFGKDCYNLIKQLSNVYTKQDYPDVPQWQRISAETYRLANQIDLRAKVIKLCDIATNAAPTGEKCLSDKWYRSKWEFIYQLTSLNLSENYKDIVKRSIDFIPIIVREDRSKYRDKFQLFLINEKNL
jgi:(p)ppGpp synthase/HD superfamily hydrolase